MYQIYSTGSSLNLNWRASQCSRYCIVTISKFWPSIALHTFQWPHFLREKHCRIHPRSLLKSVSMLGKKNPTVQNCIGRALQYISLSILLFTRLCLIMCQWNKAVKALKVQEAQKVSSKQQLMHKHQGLHARPLSFQVSLQNTFKGQIAAITIFCWLDSVGRTAALVWCTRLDYRIGKKHTLF